MNRFIKIIVGFTIIGAFAYIYRNPLQTLLTRLEGVYFPCEKPITYKIEKFDTRFEISRDYFLSALRDAEAIWEDPIGRELFTYKLDGNLKINLIYDYRQQATAQLQKLGLAVGDDKASYDAVKAKYEGLQAAYVVDRAMFNAKVLDYEAHKSAYEEAVAYWNSRHGAPRDEYERLNSERVALNVEAAELNQLQIRLNEEIDTINVLVVVLNRLVSTLNLQISTFNAIGKSRGSEFEEGTYQSGSDGQQIDIYEFEDRIKLVRVLAHEFGHALNLEHVDDPNAIMYRLNNGINGQLTATDLTVLKKLCGIE